MQFSVLPVKMNSTVKFEDAKVGNILRINNDTHTVIVFEVSNANMVMPRGTVIVQFF